MKVVIVGATCVGLEAAIIAARCQVVAVDNNIFIDRYAIKIGNRYEETLSILNEDYAKQTAPNGRTAKSHNLILSMNKKKRF